MHGAARGVRRKRESDHLRMVRTILTGQLAAMNEAGDARGVAYVAGRLTSVLETIARREPPSRERI